MKKKLLTALLVAALAVLPTMTVFAAPENPSVEGETFGILMAYDADGNPIEAPQVLRVREILDWQKAPVAEIIRKMTEDYMGSLNDIDHFLKVYGWARTIGLLEQVPEETQDVLEVAAVLHDIACPRCRLQCGHAPWQMQEELGLAIKRFAKRQMIWFRRDPEIHWIDMEANPEEEAAGLIRTFLEREEGR